MTNKQLMSFTAGLLIIGLGLATLSAKRNVSSPVVQSDNGKAHSDLASFNEKVQLAKGGDEAAVPQARQRADSGPWSKGRAL